MNNLNDTQKWEEWKKYGHTYEDHIEVNDDDLKMRLILGKYDCGNYDGDSINVASKFLSESVAKQVIDYTLKKKENDIKTWLKEACSTKTVFYINFTKQIGYGYAKNTKWDKPYPLYRLCIVLKADCHYRDYEIVTCYPKVNNAVKEKIANDRKLYMSERRNKKH